MALMSIEESARGVGQVPRQKRTFFEVAAAASRARRQNRRCARYTVARSMPDVLAACFRVRGQALRVFGRRAPPFIFGVASSVRSPNQSPEPTPGAVTPRATEGDSK